MPDPTIKICPDWCRTQPVIELRSRFVIIHLPHCAPNALQRTGKIMAAGYFHMVFVIGVVNSYHLFTQP